VTTIYKVLFLVLKRISEGKTEPGSLRSTEFKIIVNDIHMRLRPDEDPIGDIKPESPAELAEEVIAADEIRTAGKSAAGQEWRIKADALSADSSRQFQLGVLAQRRCVDQVNIIEKRTEGLKPLIKVLLGAECGIKPHAEVVIEKKIQAKCRIRSPTDCLQRIGTRWGDKSGNTKRQVKLLRLRGASEYQDQGKRHYKER